MRLTYVEEWAERGRGERAVSRCVSLHHMLEERNDANEDKRSLWALVTDREVDRV